MKIKCLYTYICIFKTMIWARYRTLDIVCTYIEYRIYNYTSHCRFRVVEFPRQRATREPYTLIGYQTVLVRLMRNITHRIA